MQRFNMAPPPRPFATVFLAAQRRFLASVARFAIAAKLNCPFQDCSGSARDDWERRRASRVQGGVCPAQFMGTGLVQYYYLISLAAGAGWGSS